MSSITSRTLFQYPTWRRVAGAALLLTAFFTGVTTAQSLPVPQVLEFNPSTAPSSKASQLWKVEVLNAAGTWQDTRAYEYTRISADPTWWPGVYPWVHWTTIGLTGSVRVRATRLARSWSQGQSNEHLTAATVLPSKYGITSVVTPGGGVAGKGMIEFTIQSGQNAYVQTSAGYTSTPPTSPQDYDTLFIFTNPPKPAINTSTMEVFGPGVHNIGQNYVSPTGKRTIYLDYGAWCIGSIDATDAAGSSNEFSVIGPGVLSGSSVLWESLVNQPFPVQANASMVRVNISSPQPQKHPVRINGPTILASPFYGLHLGATSGYKRVENVHLLSPWTFNTDAFNVGCNAQIHDCFVFNNDDTIHAEYTWDGSVVVSDCVFGGRSAFLCGYGYFQNPKRGRAAISNCSLVLQSGRNPFRAQLDAAPTGFVNNNDQDAAVSAVVVNNETFSNIVIDGNVGRLFYLKNEDTSWGNQSQSGLGNVKGLRFENITLNGVQTFGVGASVIHGKDAANRMGTPEDPIVISNLYINGTKVTQMNSATYFSINAFATVVFQ